MVAIRGDSRDSVIKFDLLHGCHIEFTACRQNHPSLLCVNNACCNHIKHYTYMHAVRACWILS